jgi:hypothetical protein
MSDRERAPRVVILNVNRRTDDSAARERARAHARDLEDVTAVPPRSPPFEILAKLGPRGGMSFAEPRFFADGERVLLSALAARGDGAYRRTCSSGTGERARWSASRTAQAFAMPMWPRTE